MNWKKTSTIAALLLAASCSDDAPAEDMRAVYSMQGGFGMVVEIDTSGDLRGETRGQDMWLLKADGVNYFVIPASDGDQVIDSRIASELMDESMTPELKEWLAERPAISLELEDAGTVTVNGREGRGYRVAGAPPIAPVPFVLSDDPELEMLKDAMLVQFTTSIELLPSAQMSMFEDVIEALGTGSPIRFGGADLETVEFGEIDDARFDLPAEPLDKEATRALMIERGMIPEEPMTIPGVAN